MDHVLALGELVQPVHDAPTGRVALERMVGVHAAYHAHIIAHGVASRRRVGHGRAMAQPSSGRGLPERVSDLRARGPQALSSLPDADQWASTSDDDRRRVRDELRVELYAVTALLTDAVVRRALDARGSFPPYGLARSRFSELGMLSASPEPYPQGSIDSFAALWRAMVDTTVLALHRELSARRRSPQAAWTVEHVAGLLPLFTADDPHQQARKRDPITFVYGGLQFGTSVCVQLAEVQTRVLGRHSRLTAEQRAAVLTRSAGPAVRLAGLDLDTALSAYRGLLSSASDTPSEGRDKPGWLDSARFAVQPADGPPHKVVLTDADRFTADADTARLGCPARLPGEGGGTPIRQLWGWCVECARHAGLLAST